MTQVYHFDILIVKSLSISINLFIFADTLKEILRELDNKLTEDDINNIIEEVDEDGSGTLDFDGTHTAG